MEPATLAATVCGLVAGKGLESFGEGMGAAAWEVVRDAATRVKQWLRARQPELAASVDDLEARPDDAEARERLRRDLESAMVKDGRVGAELGAIVSAARAAPGMHVRFEGPVNTAIPIQHHTGPIHVGGSGK